MAGVVPSVKIRCSVGLTVQCGRGKDWTDRCSSRIRLSTGEQPAITDSISYHGYERSRPSICLCPGESHAETVSGQQLSVGIRSSATADREQRNDGSDKVDECSFSFTESSTGRSIFRSTLLSAKKRSSHSQQQASSSAQPVILNHSSGNDPNLWQQQLSSLQPSANALSFLTGHAPNDATGGSSSASHAASRLSHPSQRENDPRSLLGK